MANTFVLGVGCQKGGTTWLHSYLADHPQTDMGLLKEYHLFDTLEFGDAVPFRRRFTQQVDEADMTLGRIDPRHTRKYARAQRDIEEARMRLRFYEDPGSYPAYFAELAADPGVTLVGDITPNYALLPEDRFRRIKESLEARGFDVKVVFLMRDPVNRFYSSVRMRLRKKVGGAKSQGALKKLCRTCLEERFFTERSRYDLTLERLDRCFGPEAVFLGFFEEFFQTSEVRRLTTFLGIDFVDPDFSAGTVTAPKASAMDPALLEECKTRLAPTYQYCKNRFGAERIEALWPNTTG